MKRQDAEVTRILIELAAGYRVRLTDVELRVYLAELVAYNVSVVRSAVKSVQLRYPDRFPTLPQLREALRVAAKNHVPVGVKLLPATTVREHDCAPKNPETPWARLAEFWSKYPPGTVLDAQQKQEERRLREAVGLRTGCGERDLHSEIVGALTRGARR